MQQEYLKYMNRLIGKMIGNLRYSPKEAHLRQVKHL